MSISEFSQNNNAVGPIQSPIFADEGNLAKANLIQLQILSSIYVDLQHLAE